MNKYLEKIATSRVDSAIRHVRSWGDNLAGISARKAKNRLNVFHESSHLGEGIPKSTFNAAQAEAKDLSQKSLNTRIKTGLTAAGVGVTGYLGIRKYQQHKDNKIMQRLLEDSYNNQI